MFWSSEDRVRVPFHGTFSRHGRIKASFILLIWLNENVVFHPSFFILRFSLHSHIVGFSFSVPMFLPFCPIVARLILGFNADSLVTYWGVAHVCVRTECSVRWVILSWTTVQRYEEKQSVVSLVANLWWKCRQLVTFPCVSVGYKAKFWSINLGGYRILLNIRKIGGALYFYWLEVVVGSLVRC